MVLNPIQLLFKPWVERSSDGVPTRRMKKRTAEPDPSPLRVVVAISLQFVTIPDMIISTPVASHTNSCIQSLQSLFESCVQPTCASQSGEQSRISWAYYPKAVKTNEIARSVIITYSFPCNSKICTFLSRLSTKCFEHC